MFSVTGDSSISFDLFAALRPHDAIVVMSVDEIARLLVMSIRMCRRSLFSWEGFFLLPGGPGLDGRATPEETRAHRAHLSSFLGRLDSSRKYSDVPGRCNAGSSYPERTAFRPGAPFSNVKPLCHKPRRTEAISRREVYTRRASWFFFSSTFPPSGTGYLVRMLRRDIEHTYFLNCPSILQD